MKTFELTLEAKDDLKKIAIFTEKRWVRDQRYLYINPLCQDTFRL